MKKNTALTRFSGDPFSLLKQMTTDVEQFFDEPAWRAFRWPFLRTRPAEEPGMWAPSIDVFEKEGRLVTRVDLPGLKKEEVKVEVTDGRLAIYGERKREKEEKTEDFYRCEREYGSFYRVVPLPAGVKLDDVKAAFKDGVLEVSVPVPVVEAPKFRTVDIQEPAEPFKAA